jgi:hypothetical protein
MSETRPALFVPEDRIRRCAAAASRLGRAKAELVGGLLARSRAAAAADWEEAERLLRAAEVEAGVA